MDKKILSLFAIMFTIISTLSAQASRAYCNNRFGFCLDYPAGLKVSEESPVNGDGITLEAVSGISVSVSGSYNVLDWTTEQIYDFTREGLAEDSGAEAEALDKEISDKGFEALFAAGASFEYVQMLSRGNVYLVLTITGGKEVMEEMKGLKEQLKLSFNLAAEGH